MTLSIAAERDELREWQHEKLRFTKNEFNKIDWEAQHCPLSTMLTNSHRFAIRFIYHWLPAWKCKKFNNKLVDLRCSICGAENEGSSHFLVCKHRAMEKSFGDLTFF